MEEKTTPTTYNDQLNVINIEEGDNSGCWCCGGFSVSKTMKKNWHCYICSGHKTIQQNGVETHCDYCIIPPFNYHVHSYTKDVITNKYSYDNKTSCWWYIFSCGNEFNGNDTYKQFDKCCSCYCLPEEEENTSTREFTHLKNSCTITPICCIYNSRLSTTTHSYKTLCKLSPFHFSESETKEDNESTILQERRDKCCYGPCFYSSNLYYKSLDKTENYLKKVYCLPPIYAMNETQINKKVEKRTFCGLCPFICSSTNEKFNEYQKDICGSIGPLSYCQTTSIKDNIKTSNYCITCLFGIGFCKRGRCCKLSYENKDIYCSLCRYLQPSKYEFCCKVDSVRSKSCTCFGLGNCEIIPIKKSNSSSVVPVQEMMDNITTVNVEEKEVPINITGIVRIRSMFGEKTTFSRCL